jgi:hypothetical protein
MLWREHHAFWMSERQRPALCVMRDWLMLWCCKRRCFALLRCSACMCAPFLLLADDAAADMLVVLPASIDHQFSGLSAICDTDLCCIPHRKDVFKAHSTFASLLVPALPTWQVAAPVVRSRHTLLCGGSAVGKCCCEPRTMMRTVRDVQVPRERLCGTYLDKLRVLVSDSNTWTTPSQSGRCSSLQWPLRPTTWAATHSFSVPATPLQNALTCGKWTLLGWQLVWQCVSTC